MKHISRLILGLSIITSMGETHSRVKCTSISKQSGKNISNKPKKNKKSLKSNSSYKSTKPIKSKSVGKFRNKSNL